MFLLLEKILQNLVFYLKNYNLFIFNLSIFNNHLLNLIFHNIFKNIINNVIYHLLLFINMILFFINIIQLNFLIYFEKNI